MATYKKRGSKPKNKVDKSKLIEAESKTAEVFNTLDTSASKTEQWVVKNQKYIFILIATVSMFILGFLGFKKYISEPKEADAMNEMYTAQKYFGEAVRSDSDSLFKLSVVGDGKNYGTTQISENYPGTKAGNLSNYQTGMSYLNMQNYAKAIEYLDKFSSDDEITGPLAKGGIGDAFCQLEQYEEAYDYYVQAFELKTNSFTTPMFLLKAGQIALKIGEIKKALNHFNQIKFDYPDSKEANNIDVFVGKTKALIKQN
tara:strand:+ start:1747 stop:2517 length:771 start_codon:yes stop_codon:yes gene_type:complete